VTRKLPADSLDALPLIATSKHRPLFAEWLRLDPVANPGKGQHPPIEFLTRIDLARWRDIGMGQHALRPDRVAPADIEAEATHGRHLGGRKVGIPSAMAGVLNLDPDRHRVDVAFASPIRYARMPSPLAFRDHLRDPAVGCDDIVDRDLAA